MSYLFRQKIMYKKLYLKVGFKFRYVPVPAIEYTITQNNNKLITISWFYENGKPKDALFNLEEVVNNLNLGIWQETP